jgi:hypothetical protein
VRGGVVRDLAPWPAARPGLRQRRSGWFLDNSVASHASKSEAVAKASGSGIPQSVKALNLHDTVEPLGMQE